MLLPSTKQPRISALFCMDHIFIMPIMLEMLSIVKNKIQAHSKKRFDQASIFLKERLAMCLEFCFAADSQFSDVT